ncbi:MAG: hypothetical protein JJU18_12055 [Oceanicaulis sp.]|nr:hypothetical protein [Oceanicaulis sp.]
MARIYIATNFHQGHLPPNSLNRITADSNLPETSTLGFKGIFWTVFEQIHEMPNVAIALNVRGISSNLTKLQIFSVNQSHFPSIDEDQTKYIMLFEMTTDEGNASSVINNDSFSSGDSEQKFIKELLESLSQIESLSWLKTFKHNRNFPARFLYSHDDDDIPKDASAYVSFYFLGNLLLWQVERELSSLDLKPKRGSIKSATKKMLKIEQKISNINRWILTFNVSNDQSVKAFTSSIKQKLGLKNKFDRLPLLSDFINKYLGKATSIRRDKLTQRLTTTASVIALLGVPLGFVGMLLQISPTSQLISDGPASLLDRSIIMSLGQLGLLALFISMLLAIIISILVDRD